MGSESVAIGIDLGTSNTVVSYWDPETCQLVSLGPFRSCVQFTSRGEKACVQDQTKGVALCPKRLIGKQFDPCGKYESKFFGLPVVGINEQSGKGYNRSRCVLGYRVISDSGKTVTARYVDTLILKHVKRAVEEKLGDRYTVDRAIITIPVGFSWEQRMETRRAALDAGFREVSLQQEPTMAAYYYYTTKGLTDKRVAVYDFGGGTFDACVIERQEKGFRIVKFDGEDHLGGEDITDRIAEAIEHRLDQMHAGWRESCSSQTTRSRVRKKAEELKCSLKSLGEVTLETRDFCFRWDETFIIDLRETRILDIVEDSLRVMRNILNGVSVDKVLLVGGTSDFSVVRERLQKEFPGKLVTDVDPKTCVAMGAAKYEHEGTTLEVEKGGIRVCKTLGKRIGWMVTKNGKEMTQYFAMEEDDLPKEGTQLIRLTRDDDHLTTRLIEGDSTEVIELYVTLDKQYPKDSQFSLKVCVNEDLLLYYEVRSLNPDAVLKTGVVQLLDNYGCLLTKLFWRHANTCWLCLH